MRLKLFLLLVVVIFVPSHCHDEQYTVCKTVASYFELGEGEPSSNQRTQPVRVGKAGPKGEKGDVGMQGPMGAVGPKGVPGEQGETGRNGTKGDVGPLGPMGSQGVAGQQGETGQTGEKGDVGVQGPVGAVGPQGEVGQRGETGLKGEPGEDRTNTEEIATLKQQMSNLTEKVACLVRKIELMKKNLIGFSYQLSPTKINWSDAREYCQTIGGDLAVHGMKNLAERKRIMNQFEDATGYIWIGATDESNHGTWTWFDGSAAAGNVHWIQGQPDGSGQHHVAIDKQKDWKSRDLDVDQNYALCEIPINDDEVC